MYVDVYLVAFGLIKDKTTFEDVLVCDLVLMALLTLFLSLPNMSSFLCYVSLQFLD